MGINPSSGCFRSMGSSNSEYKPVQFGISLRHADGSFRQPVHSQRPLSKKCSSRFGFQSRGIVVLLRKHTLRATSVERKKLTFR
jgi:hypothetical protein